MNRVLGRVLVSESSLGIPNLLVVIRDVDPAASSAAPASGDRLGSVITDAQGNFELRYDDADFRRGGEERRPDLAVSVLAPEEAPPAAAQERVLHTSRAPRGEAGRTESYVIRIGAATLDHARIPYPRIEPADRTRALIRSFAQQDRLREALDRRRARRLKRARAAAAEAETFFARLSLSSVAPATRRMPTYLAPSDDLAESARMLAEHGLQARRQRPQRVMRLLAPGERLQELRLPDSPAGTVRRSLVLDHINRLLGGPPYVRGGSPLPPCREERAVDGVIAGLAQAEGAGGAAGEEEAPAAAAPPMDVSADAFVRAALLSLPGGATDSDPSRRPALADVHAALRDFALQAGPADVTSFHEFHDLQIAFEHVWTEVFDEYVPRLGKFLYEFVATRVQFPPAAGAGPETVEDLQRYLDTVAALAAQQSVLEDVPQEVRDLLPDLTSADWSRLEAGAQDALKTWAAEWADIDDSEDQAELRARARALVEAARQGFAKPPELHAEDIGRVIADLRTRLGQRYKFDVFAPGYCNYGILVTYRQEWKPLTFQVGDLVSTIPLAPKESRRYATRRIVKKTRTQREIEDSLRILKTASTQTKRVDSEIVDKALARSNFQANAEGGGTIGVLHVSARAGMSTDVEKQSATVKKDFREAVLTAAQEYKHEHRLEIDTSASEESEESTSGEISNPNDEIPVTYLLYELQRRYEIREKIHRLTPVVLVAAEVPSPHRIDEAWLIAHDWILRRALLDDSFRPSLEALSKEAVGAEFALESLRVNLERQARLVDQTGQQVALKKRLAEEMFGELDEALASKARTSREEESEGLLESVGEALFGSSRREGEEGSDIDVDKAKAALERVEAKLSELESRLATEVAALQAMTEQYTAALEKHLNRKTEISRLAAHVKDNILYYMQAIWALEPPDQRFFRLYQQEALWVAVQDGDVPYVEDADGGLAFPIEDDGGEIPIEYRRLVEIADLDHLLGFKGNYMIFPLRENNFVTWYMMQEYLDLRIGVKDPDPFANYTTDELIDNIRCRHDRDPQSITPQEMEEYREVILRRLTAPRREKDEVVVPTDSLYIEALTGHHALLEDFKLRHRVLDVQKAQAEVRHGELENLRMAARLLAGEREDADVDRKIVIEGAPGPLIAPIDG